jgi:molecular chaperone Hsp33
LQADNQLRMRGLARFGDALPAAFTDLVEGGALCVTVESGVKAERYQSIVPLSEINLSRCLEHYYRQSVQLPTVFLLGADAGRAAGIMLQALPERTPGSGRWQQLLREVKDLDALRMSRLDDEALLGALFPDDDIRLFDPEPVQFHCDCSLERIENMLRMLGPNELVDLISDQDPVEIRCEFCNALYPVTAERIMGLVAELGGAAGAVLH